MKIQSTAGASEAMKKIDFCRVRLNEYR